MPNARPLPLTDLSPGPSPKAGGESRRGGGTPHGTRAVPSADEHLPALGAFLRALADRIERDPAFGRTLLAIYAESSVRVPSSPGDARAAVRGRKQPGASQTTEGTTEAGAAHAQPPPLDPFALLREHGEATLRARLGELDLAALRALVRTHRLDPARIAARWTVRERLVDLIVEQVRARASLGRAFERV